MSAGLFPEGGVQAAALDGGRRGLLLWREADRAGQGLKETPVGFPLEDITWTDPPGTPQGRRHFWDDPQRFSGSVLLAGAELSGARSGPRLPAWDADQKAQSGHCSRLPVRTGLFK